MARVSVLYVAQLKYKFIFGIQKKTQVGKLRLTSPNIERSSRAGHFDEQVGLIAFANAARIACRFAIFELAFESLDRVTLFTPLSHFPVYFFNH